jgi:hypothetical protein
VIVQFCINDLNDPTLHFDYNTRGRLAALPDAAFPDPSTRREAFRAPSPAERICRLLVTCSRVVDAVDAWIPKQFDDDQKRAGLVPIVRATGPEWVWLESRYVEMAAASTQAGSRFAVLAFPFPGQLVGTQPHPVQEQLVIDREIEPAVFEQRAESRDAGVDRVDELGDRRHIRKHDLIALIDPEAGGKADGDHRYTTED